VDRVLVGAVLLHAEDLREEVGVEFELLGEEVGGVGVDRGGVPGALPAAREELRGPGRREFELVRLRRGVFGHQGLPSVR
jgi:hypothetical protein